MKYNIRSYYIEHIYITTTTIIIYYVNVKINL